MSMSLYLLQSAVKKIEAESFHGFSSVEQLVGTELALALMIAALRQDSRVKVAGRLIQPQAIAGLFFNHQKAAVTFNHGSHRRIGLPIVHRGQHLVIFRS